MSNDKKQTPTPSQPKPLGESVKDSVHWVPGRHSEVRKNEVSNTHKPPPQPPADEKKK